MRKYEIIGAPFGYAAGVQGSSVAPSHLRMNGLSLRISQRVTNWNMIVGDSGDVSVSSEVIEFIKQEDTLKAVELYCNDLYDRISHSYSSGNVPLIIGGDHSITLGSIAAASKYLMQKHQSDNLGVIWVDAHADISNWQHGNIHGKVAASLLGLSAHQSINGVGGFSPKIKPQNLVYIGISDLMPNEFKIIQEHNIKLYGIDAIQTNGIDNIIESVIAQLEETTDGIFLSFDIDACDGGVYRGCATPEIGGLTGREAIQVAYRIAQSPKFVGADIVEFSPEDDSLLNTNQLVIKLIDAILGYTM